MTTSRIFPLPLIVIALSILTLPASEVSAQAPQYTFFDAAYVKTEPRFGVETDGWLVRTSGGYRRFHFNAEYRDVEQITWYAGLGWHGLLGKRADLVLEAHYMDTEALTRKGQVNDAGLFARGGFRWQLIRMLELNGFAHYFDFDDIETDLAYEANIVLNFTARFAVGVGFETSDDGDTGKAYLRMLPGAR